MRKHEDSGEKAASALNIASRIEAILRKSDKSKEETLSDMLGCSCCKQHNRPESMYCIRVLPNHFPTATYTKDIEWESVHWGQLKLLLSEIEFLTPHWGKKVHNVIYAGASPGVHIPILAEMFPEFNFILIDPQESMIEEGDYGNIFIMKDYMTEKLARSIKGYKDNILFISDVRVAAAVARESPEEQQDRIHRDMIAQQKWIQIMNPVSSMLKFRLPWDPPNENTEYLNGKIFFPVFGKKLTHEARLVVGRGAKLTSYNNGLYEGWMAHFNQSLRPSMLSFGGQRGCFDCTSFRKIVYRYLSATGRSREIFDQKCKEIVTMLYQYQSRWIEMRKERGWEDED